MKLSILTEEVFRFVFGSMINDFPFVRTFRSPTKERRNENEIGERTPWKEVCDFFESVDALQKCKDAPETNKH